MTTRPARAAGAVRLKRDPAVTRILRAPASADAQPSAVPPAVHDVVTSAGQPLDKATRAYMEPRFGRDFSRVRTHTDERAAASARAVDAHAYTVGDHIAFDKGRFSPGTAEGRRLIGHELAHVVQQGPGMSRLQRWASCSPARLSLEDCPPREAGEVARARSGAMFFLPSLIDPATGAKGVLIANFDIGSARIKDNLHSTIYWQRFLDDVVAKGSQWNILGFTDCQPAVGGNPKIREDRAAAVYDILPPAVKALVLSRAGAPMYQCVTDNTYAADRTFNRSVALIWAGTNTTDFPSKEVVAPEPPKFVCGPDVSAEFANAIAGIAATFAGWSSSQKNDACDALDSLSTASCAWDIVELHNNAWIHQHYRPNDKWCATKGATPGCGDSVQIGSECYYAGTANYALFGKMCRLCAQYYLSVPLINEGYARFTRSSMERLIDLYKGSGLSGISTPAKNYRESVLLANAGYDGWPATGSQPAGDRSHCVPMCPMPYTDGPFTVEWAPHANPYDCGR